MYIWEGKQEWKIIIFNHGTCKEKCKLKLALYHASMHVIAELVTISFRGIKCEATTVIILEILWFSLFNYWNFWNRKVN